MARVLKLIDCMEEFEKEYCKFLLQLLDETTAATPEAEIAVDEEADVHWGRSYSRIIGQIWVTRAPLPV